VRALDFPASIQLETTSLCNARCTFCPYPETSQTEPAGTMDDDLFESIVDQLAEQPVHVIQPFLNNDPLMDRKILPRLERLIQRNPRARVSITTNGTLLREDVARGLAELPLEKIHVSSHALTPQVYREIMAIDAYTVLRNVNVLWDHLRRRRSRTELIVTCVLVGTNRREVEHMQEYWRSRGITFYLNPLNDRAGNIPETKFIRLLPLSEKASRSQLGRHAMPGCPVLYAHMGILWNGDLITCCMDWRRARVLGNAREDSLYNLWHGAGYGYLREMSDAGRLGEVPLCRECGENKFSVDTAALRDLLAHQGPDAATDLQVVEMLEKMAREPGTIQLALLRGRGA
jgi:MoaA/NifB/PqqE/SkfB family radical SAM enzyme